MRVSSRVFLVLLLLGSFLWAIGSVVIPTDAAGPQAQHIITFPGNGFQYSPADLTIFVGDEVEWSGPFASHPLVSEENLWGIVTTGDSFQFTFTQPGVYRYFCQLHGGPGGFGMSGIIRVVTPVRTYLPVVPVGAAVGAEGSCEAAQCD